ncbi:putative EEF1A lysine methyltransferase 1 [Blattamonas nauphoetae]|uniref:EEF1A lysine methyltransferase 1 n=1 Tax=Blattamonas nauphoetae TaxID=2049346 RepID=A0ABQ9XTW3_9EUKA|nr:putative EEF1A lysine methyltransferase 1 [Blattamonas nauphoetae]
MDDSDIPQLSPETLAILQEVLLAQQNTVQTHEQEDWRLAQFWYTDETQEKLAEEAITQSNGGKIAICSAPSLYFKLKDMGYEDRCFLFEYDQRFENECLPGHFQFFSIDDIDEIPKKHQHQYDCVIIDPPRLNKETTAAAIHMLQNLSHTNDTPCILITAGWLEDEIRAKYNYNVADFQPTNKQLKNPMRAYTSYASPALGVLN